MTNDIKWFFVLLETIIAAVGFTEIVTVLSENQRFYEAIKSGYSQVYDKESNKILWQKLD